LTHGNIKGTDVPIYYYHDVPIEDVKGVRRVHDFGWTRHLGYGLIKELC
jgi:hypothetical protein